MFVSVKRQKNPASVFCLFLPGEGHRMLNIPTVSAAFVPCCPPAQPPPSVPWHCPLDPIQGKPSLVILSHHTHKREEVCVCLCEHPHMWQNNQSIDKMYKELVKKKKLCKLDR